MGPIFRTKICGYKCCFEESFQQNTAPGYIYLSESLSTLPDGFWSVYKSGDFKHSNIVSHIRYNIKPAIARCMVINKVKSIISEYILPEYITVKYSYTNSIYIYDSKADKSYRISDHDTLAPIDYKVYPKYWSVGSIIGAFDAICDIFIN